MYCVRYSHKVRHSNIRLHTAVGSTRRYVCCTLRSTVQYDVYLACTERIACVSRAQSLCSTFKCHLSCVLFAHRSRVEIRKRCANNTQDMDIRKDYARSYLCAFIRIVYATSTQDMRNRSPTVAQSIRIVYATCTQSIHTTNPIRYQLTFPTTTTTTQTHTHPSTNIAQQPTTIKQQQQQQYGHSTASKVMADRLARIQRICSHLRDRSNSDTQETTPSLHMGDRLYNSYNHGRQTTIKHCRRGYYSIVGRK